MSAQPCPSKIGGISCVLELGHSGLHSHPGADVIEGDLWWNG